MSAEINKWCPEEPQESAPSNAGGDKVSRKSPIGGALSDGGCGRWGDSNQTL
jgi:hypothetical protein